MSKPLSYSYFQKQYMQRVAAGELFIPEPVSPAVDMFVAELNKSPKGDADFSIYKLDEIEWSDFLGDIFSSEEKLERTGTGFEYRAIVEDACAQSLRTFIGKIKKVETKLALLKFFLTDDFRQNVLNKGYCAYGSSVDMIQLQCAKLMGEINRSLHGEVAPDLADITDDIAADAGDEPVNSEQDIKKIIDSLPTKKMLINEKVVEIYQLPKDEEITPIGKLIASVNKGEVQARKADWKHLVQEGFRAEQTSPMTFMYWMQESLTDIKIRDYRVDALHTILENLPAYLQELEAPDDVQNRYKQDCMNLLHYFRQINYIVPYFDEAGRYWNEHRDDDQLDVETYLYFRFLDQIDDLKEYLAFSQAHYVAIHAKTHSFIPNIVAAQSEPYWDKLVTEDIIGFCSSLYMAETTRQKFLHGWKNPYPALTIDSFPLRLRNRCFDYYIQYRKKEVMDELLSSNRRLHEPNELECLQTLMDEEQQSYNRLKGMEQFRGSEAFARVWKAGTPDILAMADFFLQYLEEKITSLNNTDTIPTLSSTQRSYDSPIDELIQLASSDLSQCSTSSCLSKAYVLAVTNHDLDFVEWIKQEQNGYEEENNLPSYRRMHCRFCYQYVSSDGLVRQYLPEEVWETPEVKDVFFNTRIRQSVSEIEDVCNSGELVFYSTVPPKFSEDVAKLYGLKSVESYQENRVSSLKSMQMAIRQRILEKCIEWKQSAGRVTANPEPQSKEESRKTLIQQNLDGLLFLFQRIAPDALAWICQEYKINSQGPHDGIDDHNIIFRNAPGVREKFLQRIKDAYMDLGTGNWIYSPQSSLYLEIEQKLRECQTLDDRVRYLRTILAPFKRFADAFDPTTNIRERKRQIEKMNDHIADLSKFSDDALDEEGKPIKDQIKFAKEFAEHCEKDIKYYNEKAHRLFEIAQKGMLDTNCTKDNPSIDFCFGRFWYFMIHFGRHLSAICLSYDILLMDIQRQTGIYLLHTISQRDYIDNYHFFSSEDTAAQIDKVELAKFMSVPYFDRLTQYTNQTDLDEYIADSHWNYRLNRVLYKAISTSQGGQGLGLYLDTTESSPQNPPKNDYSHLYGIIFNEAYRTACEVLRMPTPNTRVATLLRKAASWKFRDIRDEEGNLIEISPNSTDTIEAYHIMGFVYVILAFSTEQDAKVTEFLSALRDFHNNGVYFKMYTHCVQDYLKGYIHIACKLNNQSGIPDPIVDKSTKSAPQEILQKNSKPVSSKVNKQKKVVPDKNTIYAVKYINDGEDRIRRIQFFMKSLITWNWIDKDSSIKSFELFFSGQTPKPAIKWEVQSAVVYSLMKQLLSKKTYIEKMKNASATAIVQKGFGFVSIDTHADRLTEDEQTKISLLLQTILDPTHPLPVRSDRARTSYDLYDESLLDKNDLANGNVRKI